MSVKLSIIVASWLLAAPSVHAQYDSGILHRQQALQTSRLQQPATKILSTNNTATKLNRQVDSLLVSVQAVPAKYITKIDDKISTYSNRISGKTEETLAKLSKWEGKIKALLEKASPETAQKLFGPGQATFSSLLIPFASFGDSKISKSSWSILNRSVGLSLGEEQTSDKKSFWGLNIGAGVKAVMGIDISLKVGLSY